MTVRVLLILTICFASACGGPSEPAAQPTQPPVDKASKARPSAQVTQTIVEDEIAPPVPPEEPTVEPRVLAKHADEKSPNTGLVRPAALAKKSGISVVKQSNGEPVLLVNCPWRKYPRPSIQISLVLDEKVDLAALKPLRIDGIFADALWKQQVGSLNKPAHAATHELVKTTTAFIEYNDGKLLKHRARANSQGKASAYALETQLGTLLVFYQLEPWVDGQGTFRLTLADIDLPSKFASSGRVKVWLLSEEKVVWSANVAWPGKEPAGQRPTVGKTPEAKPLTPKPLVPKSAVPKSAVPKSAVPKSAVPKTKPPATAPKPVFPKPEDKKPVATDVAPKPPVKAPETGPSLSPADMKPSLPATVKPTPVKPPAPVKPKKPTDTRKMTVDELAGHIEKTWGPTMSTSVRKSWVAGWHNYYVAVNPFNVRKAVFMSLLKTCHKEQPPSELRDAFAILYLRLKELSKDPRKK